MYKEIGIDFCLIPSRCSKIKRTSFVIHARVFKIKIKQQWSKVKSFAAITQREISKQQALNQSIDSGEFLRRFFEQLSVVLLRENSAMLIERSPLNNLPGHVDGLL